MPNGRRSCVSFCFGLRNQILSAILLYKDNAEFTKKGKG